MLAFMAGTYFVGLVLIGVMGPLIFMDVETDRDFTVPEGAAMIFLWPISVVVITLLGVKQLLTGSGKSDSLSRKQRREIEFLKQRTAIEQEALRAQQEFERLITKE